MICGLSQKAIPSIMLFSLLAMFLLMPAEIVMIARESKKQFGSYSLKSAFGRYKKMAPCKIALYGILLFAWAGLMSISITPIENYIVAPLSNFVANLTPAYFDWTNFNLADDYPQFIIILTCIFYFILDVFVGPITEELFFRGMLTSKVSRLGYMAPVLIMILFTFYHLWLPFNNLFRIAAFLPAAIFAWKKENIFISIAFHCTCNLFSAVSFILAVC